MECNILRLKDLKPEKKQCFKTKYKNIVIVKLKSKCYSITHYQTGIAISTKRYTSINKALLDLAFFSLSFCIYIYIYIFLYSFLKAVSLYL